jgi:hypothetical protein
MAIEEYLKERRCETIRVQEGNKEPELQEQESSI